MSAPVGAPWADATWVRGAIVTAPAAGVALVTVAAVVDRRHVVYGLSWGKEDVAANLLQLREGATIRTGWHLATWGWIESAVPLLVAAVNTAVSLNVLNAGAAGIDHWAGLLVATR